MLRDSRSQAYVTRQSLPEPFGLRVVNLMMDVSIDPTPVSSFRLPRDGYWQLPWTYSHLRDRRAQTLLARLRIGHTYLTALRRHMTIAVAAPKENPPPSMDRSTMVAPEVSVQPSETPSVSD
ncbi:hypothetical protein E2C01_060007 [Portunus trituberculatus]|uniref:Uncharacterized protein n=1 Tax=Portunus trituberculatus TaxID=210409 RepID=A0A5B7H128_PORTR|nr:hypothetical protein [Portunus trituberculatus]